MTGKQVVGGICANILVFGSLALIVLTDGWAFFVLLLLILIFSLFMVGASVAGE